MLAAQRHNVILALVREQGGVSVADLASRLEVSESTIRRDLNELDRRILKEAFRQARKLQLRLKLDYQI